MSYIDPGSFLNGANAGFIAELYERYLENPGAVDESWRQLFQELSDEPNAVAAEVEGPGWGLRKPRIIGNGANGQSAAVARDVRVAEPTGDIRQATLDAIRALMLIRSYRVRGHLEAKLDPLGLEKREHHPELDPVTWGFSEGDWDRPIFLNGVLGLETATLREIMSILRDTYCGHIGVEYMHIGDPEEKRWIQERIEQPRNQTEFTREGKRAILERLTAAETFERFLDKRYTGTKRFGLDGGESLIPALEQIIKRGGQLGMKELVIGMPHRGRLNVLANFMGKPFSAIFSEFQGNSANPADVQGSGDVKYHLGTSTDREFDGNTIHLSLQANPSHLEAVNPVVLGRVRAKQRQRGDVQNRDEVWGLLMHGDAAFAGQGLVAESLELSELRGYRTGGTVHVIVNNQIGFTTAPQFARSGTYCSEMGKIVQTPIFHVNGDDPEAVVHVARIASEFRQKFKKDVIVDMFCYRRHGHNEGDEPAFTQPIMYRTIAAHPTTRQIYAQRLVEEGVITEAEADEMVTSFIARLDADFEAAKSYKPNKADWLEGAWTGFEAASDDDRRGNTAVPGELLKEVGTALTRVPEGFNLNRKIARQLEAKQKSIETGDGVDQATVELDLPLIHLRADQAPFEVIDSPLSEAAVLGFEYGHSLADPRSLVLWEAQFGDFANGAQVIIDQFIAAGESKWLRMAGLVMLLPHGYEGQGPEHSSARLERFLQLCGEDNLQVCNLTSSANYFHALRRQVRRNFRKPLVIMTPKSLLRAKEVTSRLDEMGPGTTFHRVFGETAKLVAPEKVRRVVLCAGKVYFDLAKARDERKLRDVALVRIEQLYPFPFNALSKEIGQYANAEFVWCQEEPQNMGAWSFVDRRIENLLTGLALKAKRASYVGRPEAASPATGLNKRHVIEQQKLVDEALTVR